jgi:menaquinone-dependent protoporphyrinogen oxidase
MEKKILVAFATKSGSTREIAEFITKTLQDKGVKAELKEMKTVKSVLEYDAFILGAPMYMFHIISDAHAFIKKNKKFLLEKKAAFFSLGPLNDAEKDWKEVNEIFNKEMAKYPWFTPVATEVFGGKLDPTTLQFPYNLIPAMKNMPPSDLRDWEKIKAWTESLPDLFN